MRDNVEKRRRRGKPFIIAFFLYPSPILILVDSCHPFCNIFLTSRLVKRQSQTKKDGDESYLVDVSSYRIFPGCFFPYSSSSSRYVVLFCVTLCTFCLQFFCPPCQSNLNLILNKSTGSLAYLHALKHALERASSSICSQSAQFATEQVKATKTYIRNRRNVCVFVRTIL